jgi:hypothetical protein
MIIFLQIWGGAFYLLAKIFLSRAEGLNNSQKWRTIGWIVYLVGVPAWVIVLALDKNWIAMAVEAGGVPAIILGIVVAVKKLEHAPHLLDVVTKIIVWVLVILGIFYSVYEHRGITSFSQLLELGVTAGFLIGSYLLAKKNKSGWLWFMLMNISMGILMLIYGKIIFAILQLISLGFVVSGYIRAKNKQRDTIIK